MNPNKALWEKGDFTMIAAMMRRSGEALVASLAITPPLRVLDLGCGDGTTALPLARLGAEVVLLGLTLVQEVPISAFPVNGFGHGRIQWRSARWLLDESLALAAVRA
jgi:SAM-dependent methyltransferase